jgi:hypothetical protein
MTIVSRTKHNDVIRLGGVSISPTSSQTESQRLLKIVDVCSTRHDREKEHIVGHHN